jgi:hypothetical protein
MNNKTSKHGLILEGLTQNRINEMLPEHEPTKIRDTWAVAEMKKTFSGMQKGSYVGVIYKDGKVNIVSGYTGNKGISVLVSKEEANKVIDMNTVREITKKERDSKIYQRYDDLASGKFIKTIDLTKEENKDYKLQKTHDDIQKEKDFAAGRIQRK